MDNKPLLEIVDVFTCKQAQTRAAFYAKTNPMQFFSCLLIPAVALLCKVYEADLWDAVWVYGLCAAAFAAEYLYTWVVLRRRNERVYNNKAAAQAGRMTSFSRFYDDRIEFGGDCQDTAVVPYGQVVAAVESRSNWDIVCAIDDRINTFLLPAEYVTATDAVTVRTVLEQHLPAGAIGGTKWSFKPQAVEALAAPAEGYVPLEVWQSFRLTLSEKEWLAVRRLAWKRVFVWQELFSMAVWSVAAALCGLLRSGIALAAFCVVAVCLLRGVMFCITAHRRLKRDTAPQTWWLHITPFGLAESFADDGLRCITLYWKDIDTVTEKGGKVHIVSRTADYHAIFPSEQLGDRAEEFWAIVTDRMRRAKGETDG